MKKGFIFLGLLVVGGMAFSISDGVRPMAPLSIHPNFGSAPLYFIANQGQADKEALYFAKTEGYTLWLTGDGLTFDRTLVASNGKADCSVSRLIFKNANTKAEVMASDPADYRVSYFYGSDESEWTTDLPTSRAVVYKSLYEGIDLKVYGAERQVEYDWIVKAGGRPDRIRWSYSGVSKTSLDREGNLIVETPSGRLVHRRPICYQIIDGRKVDVQAAFRKTETDAYGFAIGSYNARFALVIDPVVLVFSTYLGGHGFDVGSSIALDKTGAVYVVGYTESSDFPPTSQTLPRKDVFVSKLSPDGKSLVYSAFFPAAGGGEGGYPQIGVTGTGAVYVLGTTFSHSFPVKNAFQKTYGGGRCDGFLLELAPSGKSLAFSSFLGGSGDDWSGSLAIDGAGAVYVGGATTSKNFPVKNPFQKSLAGAYNAFISKFTPDGKSLVYSTYLGSTHRDYLYGLAVDGTGSVYVCGSTDGNNFPVKNAFQKNFGGYEDAFIAKLAPSGKDLVYSSYLGGSAVEYAYGLALDGSGSAYVVGVTNGNFPVKNAFQKNRKGNADTFVTKFSPDGKRLVYSTYFGGAGDDAGEGIALDGSGAVYIFGGTGSPDLPLKNPYQTKLKGNQDAFLSILAANGQSLLYSTYLGGQYIDFGVKLALDLKGGIYLVGLTISPDFPVLKPYQKTYAKDFDLFVTKFSSGAATVRSPNARNP